MFSERLPPDPSAPPHPAGFSLLELAKAHLLCAFQLISDAQASNSTLSEDLFAQLHTEASRSLDLLIALLRVAAKRTP